MSARPRSPSSWHKDCSLLKLRVSSNISILKELNSCNILGCFFSGKRLVHIRFASFFLSHFLSFLFIISILSCSSLLFNFVSASKKIYIKMSCNIFVLESLPRGVVLCHIFGGTLMEHYCSLRTLRCYFLVHSSCLICLGFQHALYRI